MKHLLFIIPHLDAGGAEKLVLTLCDNLDKSRFAITLLVIDKRGIFSDYRNEKIRIIDLACPSVLKATFKIYHHIKTLRPDTVFSNLSHLNCVIAAMQPFLSRKITYLAREASLPSINNRYDRAGRILNILIRLLYNRFDKIVCQSEDMLIDLAENYHVKKNKMVIINNPIKMIPLNKEKKNKAANIKEKGPLLVTICRLSREKGLDLIIEALSILPNKKIKWLIIGDGIEKKRLIETAEEKGVLNQINFLGFKRDPIPYLKIADVYVQGSRYEGFPNVLLEAIACGVPVVAFDCPGGTKEIVRKGINGILVESFDIPAFAHAIETILNRPFNKIKMIQDISNRFSAKKIIGEYEYLFISLKGNKPSV